MKHEYKYAALAAAMMLAWGTAGAQTSTKRCALLLLLAVVDLRGLLEREGSGGERAGRRASPQPRRRQPR